MNFNSLFSADIEDGTAKRSISNISKNPTDADLRLFSNGYIYPSENLVKSFNLMYQKKDSEDFCNGLDVVRTDKWGAYTGASHFILIAAVPKELPKVDLFASCKYDKKGNPRGDVMKGSNKGKVLFPMLKDLYHIELKKGEYIDLNIIKEHGSIQSKNQVYNLPKIITRGDNAGNWTYITRNNIELYPLDVVHHEQIETEDKSLIIDNR